MLLISLLYHEILFTMQRKRHFVSCFFLDDILVSLFYICVIIVWNIISLSVIKMSSLVNINWLSFQTWLSVMLLLIISNDNLQNTNRNKARLTARLNSAESGKSVKLVEILV